MLSEFDTVRAPTADLRWAAREARRRGLEEVTQRRAQTMLRWRLPGYARLRRSKEMIGRGGRLATLSSFKPAKIVSAYRLARAIPQPAAPGTIHLKSDQQEQGRLDLLHDVPIDETRYLEKSLKLAGSAQQGVSPALPPSWYNAVRMANVTILEPMATGT